MVYFPICGFNGEETTTFSNECFARCANFTMIYEGQCKPNNTIKSPKCVQKCGNKLSWVCARKDNATLSVPNPCIANCQGLEIVHNGTCNNIRVLGFSSWWSNVKEKASNTFNNVVDKTKEIVNNVVNKTKEAAEKVADKTKEIAEKVANKTKEIATKVANKTKEIATKVANTTKNIINKTKNAAKKAGEKIKNFTKKVVAALKYRIAKIGEAFQNCTCHVVEKVSDAISAKFDEWEEAAKREVELIKNKTKKWWDQTKDGFISTEKKIAGWFDKKISDAKNLTVIIWTKSRDAIKRDIDWFKRLLKCSQCNNEYKPVCIVTDDSEKATMLNQCYADCGELTTLYEGRCIDESDEQEGLVVEHVQL
jgi:ElaB/YqjD/DUF883 family membrane-anchored ribosome-binding protein